MNELIEDYQRKISSVNELLKNKDNDEETITRLKIKVGCYRSFLTDLKRALNIDIVMSCGMCDSDNLEDCGGGEYSCVDCGHFPITA